MSRRTRVFVASILLLGALVASALLFMGISRHLGCGSALAYDYDTGKCEPTNEHRSSKGLLGAVILAVAAAGMGAAGVTLLVRDRRLR